MRVALDTNRLTDLFRGDAKLADVLGHCEQVCILLPVMAEMKAGFLAGTRQRENESLLTELMAKPTVGLTLPTRQTADYYAKLFVQLRSAGTPIPINDLWIAAMVLENDLTLITRDEHFKKLPQLPLDMG